MFILNQQQRTVINLENVNTLFMTSSNIGYSQIKITLNGEEHSRVLGEYKQQKCEEIFKQLVRQIKSKDHMLQMPDDKETDENKIVLNVVK